MCPGTDCFGADSGASAVPPQAVEQGINADASHTERRPADSVSRPESMSDKYQTLDSLFELYQPYLGNISLYQPMYFLVGTDPSESKFQISLKYRFFSRDKIIVQNNPWLEGFHFAYTQTSFWDLASDSAPFEDTSYKPEIFYLSSNIPAGIIPEKGRFFCQAGLQHESNGRGGDESRSTNFLYFKPIYIHFFPETETGIMVSPKVWIYLKNDNETNPDLDAYRGFFDLEIKLGKADSVVVGSHLRWADQGGSVQVDVTCPLDQWVFSSLDFYLHVQYTSSLAESLLHYRERSEAIRIGLAVVR